MVDRINLFSPSIGNKLWHEPILQSIKATLARTLTFSRSIFPSKKFFWFGSEAIEEKSLASYLRGEKDASHNVAWAAHTGEGLLLFTKKVSEKATPAGIINLVRLLT